MIASIALILVLGIASDRLLTRLKLPGLLGMIAVGVALGPRGFNLLAPSILENAADIRMFALIIILLRAGLGLEKDLLRRVGLVALKMSALPCLLEGFAIMGAAHLLLDLSWSEAGMLGFIIAAATPAVIVPAMLRLKEQGWGSKHGVPVIVMAGVSADDVFAIAMFSTFLEMATQGGGSPVGQIARIPLQIVGGILPGALLGWGLAAIFRRWPPSRLEQLSIAIATALIVFLIGEWLGVAGLLGVMALGFVLLGQAADQAASLDESLDRVWFFAQIALFVLIGAEVNLTIAWQAGLTGLAVIVIGLLARTAGVMLALHGSALSGRERLFAAVAYLPKATVQAAIGGIPLAMGVASGETLLAVAVLAVVVTASFGAAAIPLVAPSLLERG